MTYLCHVHPLVASCEDEHTLYHGTNIDLNFSSDDQGNYGIGHNPDGNCSECFLCHLCPVLGVKWDKKSDKYISTCNMLTFNTLTICYKCMHIIIVMLHIVHKARQNSDPIKCIAVIFLYIHYTCIYIYYSFRWIYFLNIFFRWK